MFEELEAAIAVAFWALGPFLSIFLLFIVGAAVGGALDAYFFGKIADNKENGLREEISSRDKLIESQDERIEELDAELDKLKNRKRDAHGRYVSTEPVTQADGYDS